jgi:hypothetical protein
VDTDGEFDGICVTVGSALGLADGLLVGGSLKIVGNSLGVVEGAPVGLVGAGVKINVGNIVCCWSIMLSSSPSASSNFLSLSTRVCSDSLNN